MFEEAARFKLRFNSPQGKLTVEDLWDLPLTSKTKANLDDIARSLYEQSKTESFVVKNADAIVNLKFKIVKHIIDTKLAEAELAEKVKINKEKNQRIMSLIARKEDDNLANLSIEELKSQLS